MKRFQECSKFEKIWRYRWYLLIPFEYSWFIIKGAFIPIDLTPSEYYSILIGEAQIKMKWYYTMEEVKENINKLKMNNGTKKNK